MRRGDLAIATVGHDSDPRTVVGTIVGISEIDGRYYVLLLTEQGEEFAEYARCHLAPGWDRNPL